MPKKQYLNGTDNQVNEQCHHKAVCVDDAEQEIEEASNPVGYRIDFNVLDVVVVGTIDTETV
jgi:hypothetical protein